ncbi:hypothetical protein I204_05126 [Kwoniella mangroviensis CBS 8886]|nr:hypothetical protein I204_05126 [Kwoniella mangroviensis CBS 8886]
MSIENCYQHVNREIRLKQLTNFGKKRERVHNRRVESIIHCVPSEARFLEERIAHEKSKKWELICPFTGYKAGDEDDWLGILEEAIRKVTYLDHLNLDMEMVEDADPCIGLYILYMHMTCYIIPLLYGRQRYSMRCLSTVRLPNDRSPDAPVASAE